MVGQAYVGMEEGHASSYNGRLCTTRLRVKSMDYEFGCINIENQPGIGKIDLPNPAHLSLANCVVPTFALLNEA